MNTTTTTVDEYDHVAAAQYLMKHTGTTALAVLDGQRSDQPIGVHHGDRHRRGDGRRHGPEPGPCP